MLNHKKQKIEVVHAVTSPKMESEASFLCGVVDTMFMHLEGDAATLPHRLAMIFLKLLGNISLTRSPQELITLCNERLAWSFDILKLQPEYHNRGMDTIIMIAGCCADFSVPSCSLIAAVDVRSQILLPLIDRLDAQGAASRGSLVHVSDMVTKVCERLFHPVSDELFSVVEDLFRQRRESEGGSSLALLVAALEHMRKELDPGEMLSMGQAALLGLHIQNFLPPKQMEEDTADFEGRMAFALTLPSFLRNAAMQEPVEDLWKAELDSVNRLIVLMCSTPWALRGAYSTFATAVCYHGNMGDTPINVIAALKYLSRNSAHV
jgi:hypothetical protein